MKKISIPFLLLLVILVASTTVLANNTVYMYLNWNDTGTSQPITVMQGDLVEYYYAGGTWPDTSTIHTVTSYSNSTGNLISILSDETKHGFISGTKSIDTTNLAADIYTINGITTDLQSGLFQEDTLTFAVKEAITPNEAPYFVSWMPTDYTIYTSQGNNIFITDLANFAIDPDGDNTLLSYSLEHNSNNSFADCEITGSNLYCDALAEGDSDLVIRVTDPGNLFDENVVTIHVIDNTSTPIPPQFINLENNYEYGISEGNVFVVNLADHGDDPNGPNDQLEYSVISNVNTDVANCYLVNNHNLRCQLNGLGETNVVVRVTDVENLFVDQSLIISVVNDTQENHPPYFYGVEDEYAYPLDQGSAFILDMKNHTADPDGDVVSYAINDSLTNPNILSCKLVSADNTLEQSFFTSLINNIFSSGEIETTGVPSILYCDFVGETGTTTVDLIVSDGEYTTIEPVTIKIFDNATPVNHAPYFTSDLETNYSYNLNLGAVDVVDLADYAIDPDGDNLSFSLDDGMTDAGVVTCTLDSSSSSSIGFAGNGVSDRTTPPSGNISTPPVGLSVLHCVLNGVGTTSIRAIVSDGELEDSVLITINVYDNDVPVNHAPYFTSGLETNYSYNLNLGAVDVVDLADYAIDPDGDDLSFSLNDSMTDAGVVTCTLDSSYSSSIGFAGNGVSDRTTPPSGNISTPPVGLSVLHCVLNGVGTTSIRAIVSDGELEDSVLITINVYDNDVPVNHAPYFTSGLETNYSYNLNLGAVDVVDLADYAIDPDGDSVHFYLDQSETNSSVVSCQLIPPPTSLLPSVLHCNLNGVGTTKVDVYVSDGNLESFVTININVYDNDNNNSNTPPYFIDSLDLDYQYNLSLGFVDVVNLTSFGEDAENDALYYSIDTAATNSSVVVCSLINSPNDPPTSSIIRCNLIGVGTTTLQARVFDGEYSSSVTLTITVFDSTVYDDNLVATITAPSTVFVNDRFDVDGFSSFSTTADITDYKWEITTDTGALIDTELGSHFRYNFSTIGTYIFTLSVKDSLGNIASTSQQISVVQGASTPFVNNFDKKGLKILSYSVDGHDDCGYSPFVACAGGPLTISAVVYNDANYKIDNLRMAVFVPEFGLRFKSDAIDLEPGQRKTMTIYSYVPYFVEPGVYYPHISFSDNKNVRRVKYGYIEVIN